MERKGKAWTRKHTKIKEKNVIKEHLRERSIKGKRKIIRGKEKKITGKWREKEKLR